MNEEFEPRTDETRAPVYGAAPEPQKKEKKRPSALAIIAIALCFTIIGGAAGFFGAGLISGRSQPAQAAADSVPAPASTQEPVSEAEATEAPAAAAVTVTEPVQTAAQTPAAAEKAVETMARSGQREPMSAADVYEANVNSTVGITTSITTNYWGYTSRGAASGSGFIYSSDGYILTNYHVVEDSSSITVTMYDGTSYSARVVGYDSGNDLAVLKIDAEGLQPVTLGSSDALRVGDEVLAIGNPLGELTFSLTKGWVSALNREITLSSSGTTMDLIQTDTAINSGNSGGALFNMYGEVIGITNAKYSSSGYSSSASVDNIGFAIPIDSVKRSISQIIETGHIVKPYIGVSILTVSSDLISRGYPQGAEIRALSEGGPAEKAGLKVYDIITAVNGETVTNSSELKRCISRAIPGDQVTLTVYRQDVGTVEIAVTVGEQKDSDSQSQTQQSGGSQQWGGQGGQQWGNQGGQQWGSGSDDDWSNSFPFNGFPFGNMG